jgi:hypothetical protein
VVEVEFRELWISVSPAAASTDSRAPFATTEKMTVIRMKTAAKHAFPKNPNALIHLAFNMSIPSLLIPFRSCTVGLNLKSTSPYRGNAV